MLTIYDLAKRAQERNDFKASIAVTTAAAYVTGNVLGTKFKIDNSNGVNGPNAEMPLSSVLQSLVVLDPDAQSAPIDIYFFNQAPTATYTDKTAFAPSLADLKNCIGIVHVAAADFIVSGANGSVAATSNQCNIGRVLKPDTVTRLTEVWAVVVNRGTPTYVNGNIYFRFQFSQGL